MSKNNRPRAHSSEILRKFKKKRNPLLAAKTKSRMLIAARIDDILKEKEWTKKEFAQAMGRAPSLISKWLSGTHNFTHDTLVEIAHVLGEPIISVGIVEPRIEKVIVFKTPRAVNVNVEPNIYPYFSMEDMPSHIINPFIPSASKLYPMIDYLPRGSSLKRASRPVRSPRKVYAQGGVIKGNLFMFSTSKNVSSHVGETEES